MRLLLVEDDDVLAQALQVALVKNHYVVNVATDGEEGWDYAQSFTYDLMLLDVSLPKLDGISLCQRLRDHHFRNPILLLTARDTSDDKVAGLDAGADDYVVKPCTIPELLARIRALLRRRSTAGSPILYWGDLSFDPSSCEVRWQEQSLTLSPKELNLLELLLRNPTQVFTKGAILEHLWSFDDPPGEETVRAHIKGLRRKLKQVGATDVVETVYGVGYRLKNVPQPLPLESEPDEPANSDSAAQRKAAQTQAAVAQMWQQFREPILARLEAIETAIAALEANQLTEDLRADAEAQAHKLVGSLGMYGLMAGSDYARQLEQRFAAGVHPPEQINLIELLRSLRAALPNDGNSVSGEHPSQQPSSFPTVQTTSHGQLPPTATTPTVLVVDPDPTATTELATAAQQWNLTIQVAHSIVQAQAVLSQTLPQAIVLELAFPDAPQAGLQFLERLTQDHAQIPVLVLTDQDHFHDRVAVARLGGQGFFTKPLPAAQILQAVAQSCQQIQAPEAKILVVDDDLLLLQRLQDYLQAWGFLLETVSDPRQFWQVLQATQPDILILDVEMPHINGIELCQVVRNEPLWSSIPIIFLSANRDRETLQRIYEVGADDFINKPVTEPELITRVVNRLERSRLLQAMTEQDPLTGVANRLASERAFGRFIDAAQQDSQPFSLALVTINHLSQINLQYGHAVGDRILQRFGQLLKQSLSPEDIVARWLGGEFILGLYGLDGQTAQDTVLRVLTLLEQEVFLLERNVTLHLTVRGAIASYPVHGQTIQQLYQRADSTIRAAGIGSQTAVDIVALTE
ncbi:MAG: response regulator [Spirulina sp. SIO3F2]|nr:response regulator [Spirulina sp. SIO3F2]